MTIADIAFYIPLLPALLSLVKWKSMNASQRWFSILLWLIVIISFSGRVWTMETKQNNMPFYHVYILVEYLLLLQVFRLFFKQSITDRLWLVLAVGYILVWLTNVFFLEGWWGFPDYIRVLEAAILLGIISIWFRKMLREKIIKTPERTFEFWICAGLLVFFSGNLLIFIFPKLILDAGKDVFYAIFTLNAVLIILLYIIYTIALLWVKKTRKLS
jgi:hypothetical protein